uniref:SpoIIIAH-like family protein n=1 Tax=Agathobacter sp. TaxID=2021311 RepID=UPI004057AF20
MKKGIKKNQVVIATLAVLVAIAGYISYDKTGFDLGALGKEEADEVAANDTQWDEMVWSSETTEITSDTENLNPGESVLTGNILDTAQYAASVKLNREQIRAQNKDTLLEIINNEQLSESSKQEAISEMVKITDIAEKEADAEMLLEAKGFTDVVVSISDEGACDVVLNMGEVTDAKRAQVEDVVKRKTGVAADKIVITPINGGE